jgi:hypothetical protein
MAVGAKQLKLIRIFWNIANRRPSLSAVQTELVIKFKSKHILIIPAFTTPGIEHGHDLKTAAPVFPCRIGPTTLFFNAALDSMAIRTKEIIPFRILHGSVGAVSIRPDTSGSSELKEGGSMVKLKDLKMRAVTTTSTLAAKPSF